jgi:rubrerythrin
MQNRAYKELWEIRFRKIFALEKEGFLFYRRLLKEHGPLLEETETRAIVEGIMRDEVRHTTIARALLKILREKDVN